MHSLSHIHAGKESCNSQLHYPEPIDGVINVFLSIEMGHYNSLLQLLIAMIYTEMYTLTPFGAGLLSLTCHPLCSSSTLLLILAKIQPLNPFN